MKNEKMKMNPSYTHARTHTQTNKQPTRNHLETIACIRAVGQQPTHTTYIIYRMYHATASLNQHYHNETSQQHTALF